jgi:hypothetical protein
MVLSLALCAIVFQLLERKTILLRLAFSANGILHPCICPACVDRALGALISPLDGKLFAFDKKLHRNQGHTVEIVNNHFNLMPNTALVSTVPNLLKQLAADSTLETLGLHTIRDANNEVVRSRHIIPIPFK